MKYYTIHEFSKLISRTPLITVFSCKLQGKRANKTRKLVDELIVEGSENYD